MTNNDSPILQNRISLSALARLVERRALAVAPPDEFEAVRKLVHASRKERAEAVYGLLEKHDSSVVAEKLDWSEMSLSRCRQRVGKPKVVRRGSPTWELVEHLKWALERTDVPALWLPAEELQKLVSAGEGEQREALAGSHCFGQVLRALERQHPDLLVRKRFEYGVRWKVVARGAVQTSQIGFPVISNFSA